MRRLFYTGLALTLALGACKKDNSTVTPTQQNNITSQKGGDYRLVSFTGKSGMNGNGAYARLNWAADNENKMKRYVLERATSGDNWHAIVEDRCSTKPGIVGGNYSDEGLQVRQGDEYRYRITVYDANDKATSSSPLRVRFAAQAAE